MIHLIFTGGTISMQRDERAGGNVPALDGAALVERTPGLRDLGPIVIDDWGRYPACHMDQAKLWELREHVRRVAAGELGAVPQGIVIAHGTDTIEETAYLLARTLDSPAPVVITGAMRTAGDAGWDGPRNLTDAVRVAADPASRGLGTVVVFAGKILAGHQATKVHTSDLDAFAAPHGSPLGQVSGLGPTFASGSGTRPGVLNPKGLSSRVALVPVITGDGGELLDAARPLFDGVVIEGYGSGNCPPGILPAVGRWLGDGKPVVLASRCTGGEVSASYAFPGGGASLIRMGVIPAGPRSSAQGRMELAIALSAGVPYGVGS